MKKRNETIDILKGTAILAVIFGHAVQRGLVYNYTDTIAWKIIYSFHMPLFVLLSGFTLYISTSNYNFNWVKKKFYRLIIPLITWTIITEFMSNFNFTGLKPFTYFPDSVYQFIKTSVAHPDWVFWFLWTIFIFMIIFYLVNKVSNKYSIVNKYQIACFIIIEMILLMLPKEYLGLRKICYYFPMFICGYYISKFKNYVFKYLKYVAVPSIIIWVLFADKWGSDVIKFNFTIIYKYIIAFAGIISIYFVVRLFKNYLKWLAYFGRNSLELYLCESVFLNIGIKSGYIRVISIFITCLFFSLLSAKILKINKLTRFFAFGAYKNINNLNIQ
ncbi:MAG: acyltransferase [Bacillota bacterium]|nr:acyltransferase [Bacillota bacterium]